MTHKPEHKQESVEKVYKDISEERRDSLKENIRNAIVERSREEILEEALTNRFVGERYAELGNMELADVHFLREKELLDELNDR